MKFLAICERGNSRSVCLAWMLKDVLQQDAFAMGIKAAGPETQEMLMDWAHYILLCDKTFEDLIPEKYKDKLKIFDVGPDRYFRGFEDSLIEQYAKYFDETLFDNKDLPKEEVKVDAKT